MKNFNKLPIIITVSIVAVFILLIFIAQAPQNKAIRLEETVENAKSNVTVQEKRRADLIPNLVDCVKAYDEHEYNTLMAVIAARGSNSDATAAEVTKTISIVAEAYPELKSSENYRELMNELSITENLISTHRKTYNEAVSDYNKYVKSFPARLFLGITGYDRQHFERINFDGLSDAPTNLFD